MLDMVQRHLAGLQLQVDRSGVIEFDGDFLAAAGMLPLAKVSR